jgi:hypothetical protein
LECSVTWNNCARLLVGWLFREVVFATHPNVRKSPTSAMKLDVVRTVGAVTNNHAVAHSGTANAKSR